MLHVQSNPLPIRTRPRADQGQAHLMAVVQGAVDATFAAFGIDAVYTPAGGEPVSVRVIAKRPDIIVGFGETRIHARERGRQPAARGSAHGRRRELRRPGRARPARSGPARVDARCATKLIDHGSLGRAEDIIGSEV
jgi:hypothetical protein